MLESHYSAINMFHTVGLCEEKFFIFITKEMKEQKKNPGQGTSLQPASLWSLQNVL